MTPDKAIELSSQYGVSTVILFIVTFYLGGLVWFIFKQSRERELEQVKINKEREDMLYKLVEVTLKSNEDKTNERHLSNLAAMNTLAEADRRQREEHEKIIHGQLDFFNESKKITDILKEIQRDIIFSRSNAQLKA